MAIYNSEIAIRRTITIPRKVDGRSLLALIDIGGKVLNKEVIYDLFFKLAYDKVLDKVIEAYVARGGTKEEFNSMLKKAQYEVNTRVVKKGKVKKGSPGK